MKKIILLFLLFVVSMFGYEIKKADNLNYYKKEQKDKLKERLDFLLNEIKKSEYEIVYIDKVELKNNYKIEEDKQTEFVYKFLADFANKKMEFVEPEFETDDINDERLKAILSKYRDFYFLGMYEMKEYDFEGEIEEYFVGNPSFPHYDFKYYNINFDGNSENGNEDVIYSGGYWKDEKGEKINITGDFYDVLNEKYTRDKRDMWMYHQYGPISHNWLGGKKVQAMYKDTDKKELSQNYNGIIKYMDEYFIYEIEESNNNQVKEIEIQKYGVIIIRSFVSFRKK